MSITIYEQCKEELDSIKTVYSSVTKESFGLNFINNRSLFSDVNECNTGGSNCAADAVCVNTVGSFDCECSSGLGGNGKYCNGKLVFVCF